MTQTNRTLWQRIKAPTPAWWGRVRNTFAGLAAALGAGWGAIATFGNMPEGVGAWIAAAIGICTAIAAYAQTKDDVPDDEQ
jgi:hypothetical protein